MTIVFDSATPAKPRRYRVEWADLTYTGVWNWQGRGYRTRAGAYIAAFFKLDAASRVRIIDQAV